MDIVGWSERIANIKSAPVFTETETGASATDLAQAIRDGVVAEAEDLVRMWNMSDQLISPTVSKHIDSYLNELLLPVENLLKSIREARAQYSLTEPGFHSQLQAVSTTAQNLIEKVRLRQLNVHSALATIGMVASSAPQLAERIEDVDAMAEKLKADQKVVASLVDTLRNAIGKKLVADSQSAFQRRANEHRLKGVGGMLAFAASLVAAYFAVLKVFERELESDALSKVVVYVTHNVILLGAVTILSRVALRRWNLERNLQIIYRHRVAAIEHYLLLEKSISDGQEEAKDRLRLESAKMFLTDPATGYLEDSTSEVSITPVVNNVLDRFQA